LSKKITSSLVLEASPAQVIEVLQSEAFNLAKAENIGAIESNFTIEQNAEITTTKLYRALTPELPEIVESLVGKKIEVYEKLTWQADGNEATIEINIIKAPIVIMGTLKLAATNPGTQLQIELEITSNIPFIGQRVEQFAEQMWADISKKEFDLLYDKLKPQI